MKQKIYEVGTLDQYNLLVEKFGADHFADYIDSCKGFLGSRNNVFIYSKERFKSNGSSYTSATREEIEKQIEKGDGFYSDCQIVSFEEAMEDNTGIQIGDTFEILKDNAFCTRWKKGDVVTVVTVRPQNDGKITVEAVANDDLRLYMRNDLRVVKKLERKNKEMDLQETINLAKSYVGKSIYVNGKPVKLAKYIVSYNTSSDCASNDLSLAKKQIEKWGVFVTMESDRRYFLVDPQKNLVFAKRVVVNGYEAIDRGSDFEFGCARVSKDTLRAAKALLEKSQQNSDNKKIKSIKIGEGEFTLDILNDLI